MSENIESVLRNSENRSLLRLSTAGSVDDGKSTLIGRLLHDSKAVYEDHLESIRGRSKLQTNGGIDFSLLTDGLRAEREQGITIDVAYRYFSTPKRHFILADTPGHLQYTRNMATGASTSALAILLVDARNGVSEQTKRHAFISSLLGIPRMVVAVNKMDLVGWSHATFDQIRDDFAKFARKLGVRDITFIPVSALLGDNVVTESAHMPWYKGNTLLAHLENVYVDSDTNLVDFRFPVQYVLRPHQNFRGFAGKIVSGMIRPGDDVIVLPAQRRTKVKSIETWEGPLEVGMAPQSVALTLTDEVDVSRGDMIVRVNNVPEARSSVEAILIWMDERSDARVGGSYRMVHCNREIKCHINALRYAININDLSREQATKLSLNEIGRAELTCQKEIFVDSYQQNRATGNFILIDETTNATVAAGMILGRRTAESLEGPAEKGARRARTRENIFQEKKGVSTEERARRNGHRPLTIWFTGLSGSGKSTLGRELEQMIFRHQGQCYLLDGDNLRSGLNNDLGFTLADRNENIRRTAEVARLFNDAGLVAICTLISPTVKDRELARSIIGKDSFVEIHVATPIEVCEQRDVKGLYKRARAGEVKDFTGISSPYEAPEHPDLRISNDGRTAADCAREIFDALKDRIWGGT